MTRIENLSSIQPSIVLVKALDGPRMGWLLIEMDEFLEKIDLATWSADQTLIGTVLPVGVRALSNRLVN